MYESVFIASYMLAHLTPLPFLPLLPSPPLPSLPPLPSPPSITVESVAL